MSKVERKRVQKQRSKSKQLLVQKAQQFAQKSQVMINLTIFDPETNKLQELFSCEHFKNSDIMDFKDQNEELFVNKASNVNRKKLPRRNCIEEKLMSEFLLNFKRFKTEDNSLMPCQGQGMPSNQR